MGADENGGSAMGYNTTFKGSMEFDPPLSWEETEYLNGFSKTRRVAMPGDPAGLLPRPQQRTPVGTGGACLIDSDVSGSMGEAAGAPGCWCQWVASEDGKRLEWDGGEKFYNYIEWLSYLNCAFFSENAWAKRAHPEALSFLRPHRLQGRIEAYGEEWDDVWALEAEGGQLFVRGGTPGRAYPKREAGRIDKKYSKELEEAAKGGADPYTSYAITQRWCAEIEALDRKVKWEKSREPVEEIGLPECLQGRALAAGEKLEVEKSAAGGKAPKRSGKL